MGGINSKRKFTLKRSKKKVKVRTKQENPYVNEDPIYEEIYEEIDGVLEFNDRDVSDGSYLTRSSLDSAFCEKTSSLNTRSSLESYVYDEPSPSLHRGTDARSFYQTYLMNDVTYDATNVNDANDDVDDDTHTYVSDVSLRDTISDNGSMKPWKCGKCTSTISFEEVPYMVEAFQPLLEQTIDVMEVLPHLHFIDTHEFVNVEERRKTVEMLIARIKASNEPGKWQTFLHALSMTEYEYIVSLLKGETEDDHSVNRNLLELFTPHIMNQIDPDEFIDHLFEKGVINDRDMEEVKREKDRRGAIAASFMLLHKVPRRVSNWFEVFLDVLKKCGHEDLVPQFNIPEVSVCTVGQTQLKSRSKSSPWSKPVPGMLACSLGQAKAFPRSKPSIWTKADASDDEDYITPVYKNERIRTKEQLYRLPNKPVPIPPTFIHSQRGTQGTRQKTELEKLKDKKDSLQRQVEEKKLIRQYKLEVETLQKELEMFNSGLEVNETDNVEDAQVTLVEDVSNGNNGLDLEDPVENENAGVDKEETDIEEYRRDSEEKCTDIDRLKVDIDNVNDSIEKGNKEQFNQDQHITILFADMKQEIKQDIVAMRDHVTDAVLKYVISLITGSTQIENDPYMSIDTDQTYGQSPVQLFTTASRDMRGVLCPKSHHFEKQYSVDSAMFSGGYISATGFSC